DLEFTAQNVEKLLALVSVGFAAAPSGFDAEKVRFHRGVAPSKEFHADTGRGFENFAVLGANEVLGLAGGINQGHDADPIESRDAAQRGNRGPHLAAFQCAQKTNGDAGSAGDLRE